MEEELRTGFHEEIETIKQEIIKMADYVVDIIPKVTNAFLEKDLPLAQEIIDGDDELDEASVNLDESCCQALALQQPMAKDLRSIISAMSINNDIERAGDLAVNVAKSAYRLKDSELNKELKEIIQKMSDQAVMLIQSAITAYDTEDLQAAHELEKADDVLDDLNYECMLAALHSSSEGIIDLRTAVQIALLGRYYERIGDHAVNIGERIQYLITGNLNSLPEESNP